MHDFSGYYYGREILSEISERRAKQSPFALTATEHKVSIEFSFSPLSMKRTYTLDHVVVVSFSLFLFLSLFRFLLPVSFLLVLLTSLRSFAMDENERSRIDRIYKL